VVDVGVPINDFNRLLFKQGIVGGYDLSQAYPEYEGYMLLAVTELRTKQEMDQLTEVLEGILCQNKNHLSLK
jgi:glycine dehydrogenase subunit 1